MYARGVVTNRRSFLQLLGLAAGAIIIPELVVEPRRKIWQVSRSAPVPDHWIIGADFVRMRTDAGHFAMFIDDKLVAEKSPEQRRQILAFIDSMSPRNRAVILEPDAGFIAVPPGIDFKRIEVVESRSMNPDRVMLIGAGASRSECININIGEPEVEV